MASWMRNKQIDLVHTRNCVSNCWGGLAARLGGVPVRIGGEHGTVYSARPPYTWVEQATHRSSALIIANSAATKSMVIRHRRIPAHLVKVIHNAVTPPRPISIPDLRADLGLHDGNALIVGTVARLVTVKDLFTFIRSAKIVLNDRRDVVFMIVGDGPLRAELTQYASGLGLHRNALVFAGSRPDARDLMQTFSVYVSTSIQEALGNTLIEAAYAGVPVVAPAIDGIPEIVRDGETGVLVEPTDPVRLPRSPGAGSIPREVMRSGRFVPPLSVNAHRLATIILGLLKDPLLRQRLGHNAKRVAAELFSIDRYVRELESTYIQLTAVAGREQNTNSTGSTDAHIK